MSRTQAEKNAYMREWRKRKKATDPTYKARRAAAERAYRQNDPERRRSVERAWRAKNPERLKQYNQTRSEKLRQQLYGCSPEQFALMRQQQSDCCAVCQQPLHFNTRTGCHVDHCHTTGAIRGLLCGLCNAGLGFFLENVEMLTRATAYLQRHAP